MNTERIQHTKPTLKGEQKGIKKRKKHTQKSKGNGKNPKMKGKYIVRIENRLNNPVHRLKTVKMVNMIITPIEVEGYALRYKTEHENHKMWARSI